MAYIWDFIRCNQEREEGLGTKEGKEAKAKNTRCSSRLIHKKTAHSHLGFDPAYLDAFLLHSYLATMCKRPSFPSLGIFQFILAFLVFLCFILGKLT